MAGKPLPRLSRMKRKSLARDRFESCYAPHIPSTDLQEKSIPLPGRLGAPGGQRGKMLRCARQGPTIVPGSDDPEFDDEDALT